MKVPPNDYKPIFFLFNFDGLVMNINVLVNYFQGFWCSDTAAVRVHCGCFVTTEGVGGPRKFGFCKTKSGVGKCDSSLMD